MDLLRKTLVAGTAATLLIVGGATAAVAEETPAPSEPAVETLEAAPGTETTEAPAEEAAEAAAEAPTGGVAVPLTGVFYGTFTVSPKGPYKSGQVVTVSWTGMTPPDNNAGGGFFLGVCVGGGQPQGGPNACTTSVFAPTPPNPLDGQTWYLAGGNSLPNGSAKIVIPDQGSVAGFPDYPGWKCDNGAGNECNLTIGDWRGNGPTQIPIVYGTAASGGSTSGGSTSGGTTATSTSGGSTSTGTNSEGGTLADTGSGDGARVAAFGAFLLMAGGALVLATGRPRRGRVEA